ncbi:hypothetical protein HDV01_001926 [Terramyces sp. JEL0728]|nr:hypothetical protein HDV01_001926 [Terramyces sp. JEL0728]
MDTGAKIVLGSSFISSVVVISIYSQYKYTDKFIYRCILLVQTVQLLGIVFTTYYLLYYPVPFYLEGVRSFVADFISYGILYIDLHTLSIFGVLNPKLKQQWIAYARWALVILGFVVELLYNIYIWNTQAQILYQISDIVYLAIIVIGIVYVNWQGMYITRLIMHHRQLNTSMSIRKRKVLICSMCVMLLLDWSAVSLYIYGNLYLDGLQHDLVSAICLGVTGIHCAIASFNFGQFKDLTTKDLASQMEATEK